MKFILLSFFLTFSTLYSYSQNLYKNLVAYYPFDGDADNKSDLNLNGKIFGATLTKDRFERPDKAFYFNGIDNYITLPLEILNRQQETTISFWIKVQNIKEPNYDYSPIAFVFSYEKEKPQYNIMGLFFNHDKNNETTQEESYIAINSGTSLGWSGKYYPFPLNKYVNVVITYDLITAKYFINGKLMQEKQGSLLFGKTEQTNVESLIVGRNFNHLSNPKKAFAKFCLDDILVFNRTISNDEVKDLYEYSKQKAYFENPIVFEKFLKLTVEDKLKQEQKKKIDEEKVAVNQRIENERVKNERKTKIQVNSNYLKWTKGDKICNEINNGILMGVIDDWNENKSKAKIKVIAGPEGSYEGEPIVQGSYIWTSTVGKGWHLCLDDEMENAMKNNDSEKNTTTSSGKKGKKGEVSFEMKGIAAKLAKLAGKQISYKCRNYGSPSNLNAEIGDIVYFEEGGGGFMVDIVYRWNDKDMTNRNITEMYQGKITFDQYGCNGLFIIGSKNNGGSFWSTGKQGACFSTIPEDKKEMYRHFEPNANWYMNVECVE